MKSSDKNSTRNRMSVDSKNNTGNEVSRDQTSKVRTSDDKVSLLVKQNKVLMNQLSKTLVNVSPNSVVSDVKPTVKKHIGNMVPVAIDRKTGSIVPLKKNDYQHTFNLMNSQLSEFNHGGSRTRSSTNERHNRNLRLNYSKETKARLRKFPVSDYALCVIDPMMYASVRIPDEITTASAILAFRQEFKLTQYPIRNSIVTDPILGYGCGIVIGALPSYPYSSWPPISVATNMVFGQSSQGASFIKGSDVFGVGISNNMLLGPVTNVGSLISAWRPISACISTVNGTAAQTRHGDFVMSAFPSGNIDDIFSRSVPITWSGIRTAFPNTAMGSAATQDPYAVWYPSSEDVREYASPQDAQNNDDNSGLACNGGLFLWFDFTETVAPGPQQDITVVIQMTFEVVPQNSTIQVLATSPSFSDTRKLDNAANMMSTQDQLHVLTNADKSNLAPQFQRNNQNSRSNKVKKPNFLDSHPPISKTKDETFTTTLHVPSGNLGSVSSTASDIWDTIKPIAETALKYTPTVLDVLSTLGL